MKSKNINGVRNVGTRRGLEFWERRLLVARRELASAEYFAGDLYTWLNSNASHFRLRKHRGCALSSRLKGVELVRVMRSRKNFFLRYTNRVSFVAKKKRKIPILKQKTLFYESHVQKFLDKETVKDVLDE